MDVLIEYGPMAALMLVGLYAVAVRLIAKMAARPSVDGWDKAKAVTDKLDPYVEKIKAWADPDDPEVPTGPTETK